MFRLTGLWSRHIQASVPIVALLGMLASGPATADEFCLSAPEPGCLLDMAHDEASRVSDLNERAALLMQIGVGEAHAGFTDQSEVSFDMARLLADSGRLLISQTPPDAYGRPPIIFFDDAGQPLVLAQASEEDLSQTIHSRLLESELLAGWPVERVVTTFPGYKTPGGPVAAYGAVVPMLISRGERDRALDAIRKMEAELDRIDDPVLNGAAARMIVNSHAMAGDFAGALVAMNHDGVPKNGLPRIGMLAQIQGIALRADDIAAAADILTAIEREANLIADPAQADAAQRMAETARLALFEEKHADESRPSKQRSCRADPTLTSMAIGLAGLGFFDFVVDEALQIPEPAERDRTLRVIARLQSDADDLDGAAATTQLLADESLRIGSLEYLARCWAQRGDAAKAVATAMQIVPEYRRRWSLAAIVELAAGAGNIPSALDIARGLPYAQMRAGAYVFIAEILMAPPERPQ